MRHRTSMASLFDGIFQASGDMPVNSLFSSSNKFKTVRPAETLAAEAPAAQSNVEKQAKPASTISAKNVSKGSKRKAAAAAEPQLNTTHKRSKVAASHSPLHDNKGSKRQQQKTATAAAEEPHSKKRKKPEAAPSVDGGASSAAAEHSNISSNGQAVPVDASDANAETVTVCITSDQDTMTNYFCLNEWQLDIKCLMITSLLSLAVSWAPGCWSFWITHPCSRCVDQSDEPSFLCRGSVQKKKLQNSEGPSSLAICPQTSRRRCCRMSLASKHQHLH